VILETVSFEVPIDSNMNPAEWSKMATLIEQNYSTYDCFVVLHGSDTMSHLCIGVEFMLENLDKPVILQAFVKHR
jgi:L-asparaginase